MSAFIHDDFLLQNEPAKVLYHEYAKDMPIIDYHCHLSPQEIAENKKFSNLAEIWLHGDHYKWRAMRYMGIDERYITGDATDYEKFQAWANAVPRLIGNPLYHWSHLELKRYFGIDELLNERTADDIWHRCNDLLQQEDFPVQQIIARSNVEMIGTTDDPLDELAYHTTIRKQADLATSVLPSFRPDPLLEISAPNFLEYIHKLSQQTGNRIEDYREFLKGIKKRVAFFHEAGCRISDHGLNYLPYEDCSEEEAADIFAKALNGKPLTAKEEDKYKTFTLRYLGELYHENDWVMQLHIGPIRSANSRMFDKLGPNTGFDSINDFELAKPLNQFLDSLDKTDSLPKTVLYSLNPTHNYIVATAAGNFQGGEVKGKVQMGSGWWFNDHKDGMVRQMTDLANIGVLSSFVGMLTDSRSFLSFTRHEYFRRILCNLIGTWVVDGEVPWDDELLGKMVQDISYYNARDFFGLKHAASVK
ncbi:glucuronate isomerase [Thalassobacillus pellis]|uniref:glucuronate isomerase n=1 Tax=Thalassobacillus pellis TaxID=748008 RepID=UPI00195FF54E|nr:glucuronate isomerase [Thalassobacillus pellis]